MTTADPQAEPLIGTTVGNYRVVEHIGGGGMGDVYLAKHNTINYRVAVKFLREFGTGQDEQQAQAWARFCREAEALASLQSEHIVRMSDLGRLDNGRAYLILEYLEGKTLFEALAQRGALSPDQVIDLGIQVCTALSLSHGAGVIHRDLKPGNIMLMPRGTDVRVVVLDFGIARRMGGDPMSQFQTRAGLALGTPAYMAPEQIRDARSVDTRTDIYALGVVLYESLSGRRPFNGGSHDEVLANVLLGTITPLQSLNPTLPAELCECVHKAMSRDPDERFATAAEFVSSLRKLAVPLQSQANTATPVEPPAQSSPTTAEVADLDLQHAPLFEEGAQATQPLEASDLPPTQGGVAKSLPNDRNATNVGAFRHKAYALAGVVLVAVTLGILVARSGDERTETDQGRTVASQNAQATHMSASPPVLSVGSARAHAAVSTEPAILQQATTALEVLSPPATVASTPVPQNHVAAAETSLPPALATPSVTHNSSLPRPAAQPPQRLRPPKNRKQCPPSDPLCDNPY